MLGRAGSDIEFASGDQTARGYRAVPAAGHGPGVMVVHEGFGLVDQVRDVGDRLAREGFVALAPDLYHGQTGSTVEEAARLMSGLEASRVERDLDAAVAALLNDAAVDGGRVGAIGFCMGGHIALRAAMVPANLVREIIGVGLDFDMSPLDVALGVVAGQVTLWERRVVFDVHDTEDAAIVEAD